MEDEVEMRDVVVQSDVVDVEHTALMRDTRRDEGRDCGGSRVLMQLTNDKLVHSKEVRVWQVGPVTK